MKKIAAVSTVCTDVFMEINEIHPGGEALNFCGNICRLPNIASYLLGAVGKDVYGSAILDTLKNYPINTDYLQVLDGQTAHNKIYLTPEGDRYFHADSWNGGLSDSYRLREGDIAFLKNTDAVHTTVFTPALPDLLRLKKEHSFLLAVDFNEERSFSAWEEMLPFLDIFFISGEEAILPCMKELSRKYDTILVATLAERGSIAYHHGNTFRAEAVPVKKVVDTTGCGDSYQAGFVASYCQSADIEKAMRKGSLLAAKTLSHVGGF